MQKKRTNWLTCQTPKFKRKITRTLIKCYRKGDKFFLKKKYTYLKARLRGDVKVWFMLNFALYADFSLIFKTFLQDKYYITSYKNLSNCSYLLRSWHRTAFDTFTLQRTKAIHLFMYTYNNLFFNLYSDVFFFIKKSYLGKTSPLYRLILTFNKLKLFINLLDKKKRNYVSVSTGLFIKFFEKKKSLKRAKTIKILMAKYFRKLLLISRVYNLILIVKKIPAFLPEIVNFLNQPIAHKFIDPLEHRIIDENEENTKRIKFFYFIFLHNRSFVKNKIRQSGRIKRKIRRKLILENSVID